MSFGDFEYQETTSNQLARILKGMRQEQVILDAVQNPIDDIEEYPDARIIESVKGIKDHIGAVTIPTSGKSWHFANEPNQDTRLWLWFREGWRLRDYSRHGNDAFASQLEPAPYPVDNYVPLRRKINDDGTTSGRLHGIIDGKSQYYRVHNGPENRITDLLVTNSEICFSIYFSPYQTYILDDDDCATVFQKLDDDQSYNAIRVCAEADGTCMFSLAYQGFVYEVTTAPGVIPVLELPEFVPGQFIDEEFLTQSTKPWQWNPDVNATDWTWLFFTFNKNTRQLKIFKVADGGFTATELVTSSDETGMLANMSLWIPANEGSGTDATTAYDIISDHDAVFAASPNAPEYTTDGYLHFSGDTKHADIVNHANINTLTTFTIAFKVRLHSYATGGISDIILSKDRTDTTLNNGGWEFTMSSGGTGNIFFGAKNNGGTSRSLTVTNGIASLNTWYDVIVTYNGTQYTLDVGSNTATPLSASSDTLTSSAVTMLGHGTRCFQGDIADVVIVKGEAWNTTKKNWYKAKSPAFKALFPAWKPPKPPEPETPVPIVRPMEIIYDVPVTGGTNTNIKLNASQLTTPYVEAYNVAGGTPATTPEELKYDCADGTTGGGSTVPISTIYNLAAASSTGSIASGETGYIQRIVDTSSVLYNKKPTDLQFWINDSGGDCDGMAYPAIIRTNGTYTKIGAGMNVSSLTSTWVSISGVSYVDRTALAVGDGVGIIREGHSNGTLGVRRGGSNIHYDNAGGTVHSYQHRLTGTTIGSANDEWSIAGVVKVGGETIPGTNPYMKMGSTIRGAAIYQLNSTIENIAPTKVIWRVRRVGSAASATLRCVLKNTGGTVVQQFGADVSFNSISTTIQDLQFVDTTNINQWVDGYRLELEFVNVTGINDTTNYLEVNYNVGSGGAGQVGGTSLKAQYRRAVAPLGFFDVSPVCDWAGKVYVGGSSFSSYISLNNTVKRVGEKINSWVSPNISVLFGKKISKAQVTMMKTGSPSGLIKVNVYNGAGAYLYSLGAGINATTLTGSDANYVFTYPGDVPSAMAGGERIMVVFEDGTATDFVNVKVNTNTAAGASGDGTKSILTKFLTDWLDDSALDLSGILYTGGIPDLTSRQRAAIRCDSIFSQIYSDKITQATLQLAKLGSPTGFATIKTIRGSDGANRDILGTVDVATLSTSLAPITRSNFTATHFMGESDKLVVEYSGGDPSNALLVAVKQSSTYDDEDTQYEEWNGFDWFKDHPDWDMVATLWTGGDTYTPDAGTIYVEPPDFYDHDLLIGGGAFVENEFTSFYGMRVRDFKIETSIPTLGEIDTLFDNKYSRRGGKGEVALVGYSTLNSETEPPP